MEKQRLKFFQAAEISDCRIYVFGSFLVREVLPSRCFSENVFCVLQKYEMIKTEEIPNLENSNFSTKVIKDIAQNILSFLKSNCTKEGHTYWLFKGKRILE